MQDNRSAPDQENRTFTWYKSRPRSARLFPVDYSLEEFSSALNQDKRNVKKNLLLHPYVADSLFDLLFSDSAPQNASNSSVIRQTRTQGIPPIPLEAAPYLACFYEQVLSDEYRSDFSPSCPPPSQERTEAFVQSFLLSLYHKIKGDPAHDYCRHVMFDDPVFREALLHSLWAGELTRRFEALCNTARQTDPNVQTNILLHLFQYIDQMIYALANTPAQDTSIKATEEALQHQLRALLSQRKKRKEQFSAGSIQGGEFKTGRFH